MSDRHETGMWQTIFDWVYHPLTQLILGLLIGWSTHEAYIESTTCAAEAICL